MSYGTNDSYCRDALVCSVPEAEELHNDHGGFGFQGGSALTNHREAVKLDESEEMSATEAHGAEGLMALRIFQGSSHCRPATFAS